jgi:hypothetical protein
VRGAQYAGPPAKREAKARMLGSRRWQSPADAPAATDDLEEDTGGVGGPSRRPLRHGLHRASPYGGAPRRWLSKLPVTSRIFPTMPRDRAASGDSPHCPRCLAPLLTADARLRRGSNGETLRRFTYSVSDFVAAAE